MLQMHRKPCHHAINPFSARRSHFHRLRGIQFVENRRQNRLWQPLHAQVAVFGDSTNHESRLVYRRDDQPVRRAAANRNHNVAQIVCHRMKSCSAELAEFYPPADFHIPTQPVSPPAAPASTEALRACQARSAIARQDAGACSKKTERRKEKIEKMGRFIGRPRKKVVRWICASANLTEACGGAILKTWTYVLPSSIILFVVTPFSRRPTRFRIFSISANAS